MRWGLYRTTGGVRQAVFERRLHMEFRMVWDWVQKISAIVFAVCFVLYVTRCAVGGGILNLEKFAHFMQGLLNYIFT
jgi:hypothetical protein